MLDDALETAPDQPAIHQAHPDEVAAEAARCGGRVVSTTHAEGRTVLELVWTDIPPG